MKFGSEIDALTANVQKPLQCPSVVERRLVCQQPFARLCGDMRRSTWAAGVIEIQDRKLPAGR